MWCQKIVSAAFKAKAWTAKAIGAASNAKAISTIGLVVYVEINRQFHSNNYTRILFTALYNVMLTGLDWNVLSDW